jgi:hypothetical protein
MDATDVEVIRPSTNFLDPPLTGFPLTEKSQGTPRAVMARRMFLGGHFIDVILKGLAQNDDGMWIGQRREVQLRRRLMRSVRTPNSAL